CRAGEQSPGYGKGYPERAGLFCGGCPQNVGKNPVGSENKMMNHQEMVDRILQMGAQNAAVIPMSKVRFEMTFRELCASNACPMWESRKSWWPVLRNMSICWFIRPSESWKTAMILRA